MTKQEIFNKVAKHLIKQNCQAENGDGSCAYRGANGTSCAVGCLIPDDTYDPEMEGASINASTIGLRNKRIDALEKALIAAGVYEEKPLLDKLQCVHDMNAPEDWKQLLSEVASNFGLEMV